jgi:photosystem II stability/assembly factor-like uncharacterized protein
MCHLRYHIEMTVQTPPTSPSHEFDIDAGVLKDARSRQQRHQGFAALLIAIAVVVGVLMFGGSGGGGSGTASKGRGNGSSPDSAAHTASQVGPAVPYSPATIAASGLLSPGVGWAVNGIGFYMTWDGGRLWSDVHVPALNGDAIAGFMAADSPSSRTLVLAIGDSGSSYGTCADPAGSASRAVGYTAVSTDAGHSWRTTPFPDCSAPTQISFINARTGFAVTESGKRVTGELLYRTTDGGRIWHRVGGLPKPGPIDFTSLRSGWLLAGNKIYRTSDGGKTWQRANVCRQPADRTVTLDCGRPLFFGAQGVIETIRAIAGVAASTSVTTTSNNGARWTTHNVTVSQRVQGSLAAQISAASPKNLFFYFQGSVMARSTNGGLSWHQLPAPKFEGGAEINFVTANYGWIQDGGSLYATTDGGTHWHRMKQLSNKPPTP